MASAAKKYAFRRRFEKHNYSLIGAELSDEDDDDGPVTDAMTAAAEAGLDAGALSHMEERDFKHVVMGGPARIAEYLGVRNHILTRWNRRVDDASESSATRDTHVPVDEIVQSLPDDQAELARETHAWLVKHGGVNYGCPDGADLRAGDALKAERAAAAANEKDGPGAEKGSKKAPSDDVSDDRIIERTVIFLRGADMNSTTERQIRAAVEADLDRDLSDRKLVIRSVVTKFLADPDSYAKVGDGEVGDKASAASFLAKTVSAAGKGTKPKPTKPVIVVGAGPAGLAAARAIRADGHDAVVLEARDRVGGRVFTCAANSEENPLSVPIDFGASIVTGTKADPKRRTARPWLGVRADPSFAVAKQLRLETTILRDDLPLFDGATGARVSREADARVEKARDALMDHARLRVDREGADALADVSLERVIAAELLERYGADEKKEEAETNDADESSDGDKETLSPSDRRVLGWHWANLEYGCSAPLSKVSMAHWNQDEAYGGFGGPHCMLKGGYGAVTDALAVGLDVRKGVVVSEIRRVDGDGDAGGVFVTTTSGETFEGSACVVTVPLGCLKRGDVTFSPPLSLKKQESVARLGFGRLNKIALEFSEAFWNDSVDYFGCAAGEAGDSATRGRVFMFWNLQPVTGKPVLAALVAGEAAEAAETEPDASLRDAAVAALRTLVAANAPSPAVETGKEEEGSASDSIFTSSAVPDPIAAACTRWGGDAYSRGSYSYVAVGASGDDYDELGRPEGRVLFAGEHTCREHPDTVGGAMLSGWRAARHAAHIMRGDAGEPFDEVFALPALDDLVKDDEEEDDEIDEEDDEEDDTDNDTDDDELEGKKKKKKKRRRGKAGDGGDGPEDDDAARERARKRLAREAAERLEQIKRDAREATDGKEEVKKVLRVVGDGFGSTNVASDDAKFEAFCALARSLETASGRRAFVDAAADALPESRRATWASERDGLPTLVSWMEQITTKESGAALASRAVALLLKLPVDVRAIRASGAARVMQQRFATHPKPEVRLLARECARKWTRAVAREKAARASEAHDAETPTENGANAENDAKDEPRESAKRKQTVDEMIAAADGLAEGGAATEAARAARDAEAALAAATSRAEAAAARSAAAAAAADAALRDAWSAGSTKKNAFKQRSFEEYEAHKKRKREFKKREKERREREDAAEAAEDARMTDASADVTARLRASAAALESMHAEPQAAADAASGPHAAALREIRERVLKFARAHLMRSPNGKKMGDARRNAVAAKTAAKVCENSTSADAAAKEGGDAVANFLTQQRKSKIKKMLDAYVTR